jgi:rubrerythrin
MHFHRRKGYFSSFNKYMLYKEALENLDQTEEVFYYLCPVCGSIEKSVPKQCKIFGAPGEEEAKGRFSCFLIFLKDKRQEKS